MTIFFTASHRHPQAILTTFSAKRLFAASISAVLLSACSVLPAFSIGAAHHPVVFKQIQNDLLNGSEYYDLSRAEMVISAGDYAMAIPMLKNALEKDSINIFALYNLGFCYQELAKQTHNKTQQQNFFSSAEYYLERVQSLSPDLDTIYFKLGKLALQQGKYDAARHYYEEGMAMFPENASFAFNLARVYDQEKNAYQAIKYYRKAITLQPDFIFAYNNLGLLLEQQKDYDEAEVIYKKALNADFTYNYARLNLGNLYAEQGKNTEAKALFKEALELEPDNGWAELYLANVYFQDDDYISASAHYEKALAINPDYAPAYYLYAVSLMKLDKVDDALQAGQRYIKLDPEGVFAPDVHRLIVALQFRKGHKDLKIFAEQ